MPEISEMAFLMAMGSVQDPWQLFNVLKLQVLPSLLSSLRNRLGSREVDYINFYFGHFPLQFIVHPSSFLLLVIEITMMRMTTMRMARMMPPMMNFHLRFLQHIFQWTSLAFSLNTWAILSRFSARLSSSLSFPPRSCNLTALSRKVFVTSSTWEMVVQKVIPKVSLVKLFQPPLLLFERIH